MRSKHVKITYDALRRKRENVKTHFSHRYQFVVLMNPEYISEVVRRCQLFLKQVTATDGDKDRPQNIVYFLTGQGIDPDNPANSKFDINRTSGEIYVLKVINFSSPSFSSACSVKKEKKEILSLYSSLSCLQNREREGRYETILLFFVPSHFRFSPRSHWTGINRTGGRSGGSRCSLRTKVGRVWSDMPTCR